MNGAARLEAAAVHEFLSTGPEARQKKCRHHWQRTGNSIKSLNDSIFDCHLGTPVETSGLWLYSIVMHKGRHILFCILIGITLIAPLACNNQKISTIIPTPILIPTVSITSTIASSRLWYDGNTEAYWYEDPKGAVIITANGNQYAETIQTNNVARLQKIVPFTLVFPDYLPEDIDRTYPPAFDMQLGPSSSNETKVSITYEINKVPNGYIEITESNSMPQSVPNRDDLEFTYLDFDNTKILEEKYRDSVTDEDQQTPIITYYYYTWNWNNIGFSSTVEGYDQSESRKIVESLIK